MGILKEEISSSRVLSIRKNLSSYQHLKLLVCSLVFWDDTKSKTLKLRPHSKECGFRFMDIIKFLIFLYLFIFSLVLIKEASSSIGQGILKITKNNINPINAFGVGWLITIIMQSSGAATSALIALNAAGFFGPVILIFMVLGTRIGTSITSMIVSLFCWTKKRRDFRHGFEIALANLVYAIPILTIMLFLEYFFNFFSNIGSTIQQTPFAITTQFSLISFIISPPIKMIMLIQNKIIILLIGLLILSISLKKIPPTLISVWGKENTKKIMNKYMQKKYNAFLIGFLLTAITLSTSITLSLLVPLVISRFINLKKIIPYLIGANLGGVMDIILVYLIIGKTSIPAVLTYISFSIIGLLWLFNTDLLFNLTKYLSKKIIHVSRTKAIIFTIGFIVLAVILFLI